MSVAKTWTGWHDYLVRSRWLAAGHLPSVPNFATLISPLTKLPDDLVALIVTDVLSQLSMYTTTGVSVIVVFDGKPPAAKRAVIAKRKM